MLDFAIHVVLIDYILVLRSSTTFTYLYEVYLLSINFFK